MNNIFEIKLLLFFVLFSQIACKEHRMQDENVKVIKGYTGNTLENGMGVKIKTFKIVPLEMTSSSILSSIDHVEFMDSLIIIHNDDKLLCFNSLGKFRWAYGVKGRGPGEYLRINTFFIDKNQKSVVIIDEFLGKILIYDISGKFVEEKKYPRNTLYMTHTCSLLSNRKLFRENYIYNDFNNIYSILDLHTGKSSELYRLPVKTQKIAVPVGNNPVSYSGDTIKMLVPFDNNIYMLQDSLIVPFALIETDKKILSQKKLESEKDFSIQTYFKYYQEGFFLGFKDIVETKDYMLLNEAGWNNYFLIDKNNCIGYLYSYKVEENIKTLPLLGIIAADSNYFVGYCPAYSLRQMTSMIGDPTDKYLQEFKRTVGSLKEDANPCLLFYEL